MSNKGLILRQNVTNIANNIRNNLGISTTYKPSELADGVQEAIDKYKNNCPTTTSTDGTCSSCLDVPCKEFIIEGNSTQESTPSPSSPVEIVSVRGKNLLEYRRPDYSGHDAWYGYGNYSYILVDNGVELSSRFRAIAYDLSLISGETYTFSFDAIANLPVTIGVGLNVYMGSTAASSSVNKTITATKTRYSFTFTATDTNRIAINSGSNTNLTSLIVTNFQIEQGSIATSYLPYNTLEIEQSGKNIAKTTDCDLSGTNYTYKIEDGSVNITTASSANSFDLCGGLRTGVYLPSYSDANDYGLTSADGSTYIISLSSLSGSITGSANTPIYIYTNQRSILSYITPSLQYSGTKTVTLQDSEYIKSIYLWTNNTNTLTDLEFNVQLEKGSSSTTYEPYHTPISHQVSLGDNTLKGIGTIKDKISIDYLGNVGLVKNIGEKAFTGASSESWVYFGTNSNRSAFDIQISDIADYIAPTSNYPNVLSNRFIPISQELTWVVGKISQRITEPKYIYLCVDTSITDLTTFKTWLSTHNTIVQYVLATPTTETLTSTTPIVMWEGTNIFNIISIGTPGIEINYITKTS